MPLAAAWRNLHRTRFPELAADCGNASSPGVIFGPDLRDWSDKATTEDQYRIEHYIDRFDLRDKRLLHIGIGNSGLAKRFAGRVKEIVGTTIDQPEIDVAASTGLPGYSVVLQNKYAGRPDLAPGLFDFIIDNNPTSPCCCMFHFAALFELYMAKLAPVGQIVTDRQGLAWIPPGSHSSWSFDFDDLAAVAAVAGLTARKANRNVYVLSRGPAATPGLRPRLRNVCRRAQALPGRAVRAGPSGMLRLARRITGGLRRGSP